MFPSRSAPSLGRTGSQHPENAPVEISALSRPARLAAQEGTHAPSPHCVNVLGAEDEEHPPLRPFLSKPPH